MKNQMTTTTIHVSVPEELSLRLRQQAELKGLDLEAFVRLQLEESVGLRSSGNEEREGVPSHFASRAEWRAAIRDHSTSPVQAGTNADWSREAVYNGGE